MKILSAIAVKTEMDCDFYIFETMRWQYPSRGFYLGEAHLSRLAQTAQHFGFDFDRGAIVKKLEAMMTGADCDMRVRLALYQDGRVEFSKTPLQATRKKWQIAISKNQIKSDDIWLGYKTSKRALYNDERAKYCAPQTGNDNAPDELIYLNEKQQICEGTITNIFLERDDGLYDTPHHSCGLLPGILRKSLIESGQAIEAELYLRDLKRAQKIFVGNALRGLILCEIAPPLL